MMTDEEIAHGIENGCRRWVDARRAWTVTDYIEYRPSNDSCYEMAMRNGVLTTVASYLGPRGAITLASCENMADIGIWKEIKAEDYYYVYP